MPYRLLKAFHKIQQRLVRELEKKFSGRDVVIVANRRILPPPRNGKTAARPRSRTLTAVSSSSAACRGGIHVALQQPLREGRARGWAAPAALAAVSGCSVASLAAAHYFGVLEDVGVRRSKRERSTESSSWSYGHAARS